MLGAAAHEKWFICNRVDTTNSQGRIKRISLSNQWLCSCSVSDDMFTDTRVKRIKVWETVSLLMLVMSHWLLVNWYKWGSTFDLNMLTYSWEILCMCDQNKYNGTFAHVADFSVHRNSILLTYRNWRQWHWVQNSCLWGNIL